MHSIPKTMAAVQLVGHGGLDKLVYNCAAPVPQPTAGEVLISVTACGMNNTDVWVRQGAYGIAEPFRNQQISASLCYKRLSIDCRQDHPHGRRPSDMMFAYLRRNCSGAGLRQAN